MKELIVNNRPTSPISESYRSIRTHIEFANVDNDFKSIMFTSSIAGEGKTTSLCNIAKTLVDNGHSVIILDCDMRKPRIHKFFSLSNINGLSELLLSKDGYESYIQRVDELKADVITAGKIPKNPSELLSSKAMKKLIEKIKENYDYVLIDSPPITPVTDGIIMSTYIDRVVLVCASGVVKIEFAKKAMESLKQVGARVLGVLLNKVNYSSKTYDNYYYYQSEAGES